MTKHQTEIRRHAQQGSPNFYEDFLPIIGKNNTVCTEDLAFDGVNKCLYNAFCH